MLQLGSRKQIVDQTKAAVNATQAAWILRLGLADIYTHDGPAEQLLPAARARFAARIPDAQAQFARKRYARHAPGVQRAMGLD